MHDMRYRTIYSILDHSARIPSMYVAIGLFAAATAFLVLAGSWRRNRKFGTSGGFLAIWAIGRNAGVLPASWAIYRDHEYAQSLLRDGKVLVTEGPIERFFPMPYHGQSIEQLAARLSRRS